MGKVKKVSASGASYASTTTEESPPLETHQWHGRHIREVAGLRELGPVIPVDQYDGLGNECCTISTGNLQRNYTRFGRWDNCGPLYLNCKPQPGVGYVGDCRYPIEVKSSACATKTSDILEYPRATECRSLNGQYELFVTEAYNTDNINGGLEVIGTSGGPYFSSDPTVNRELFSDCLCTTRAQRCRDYNKPSIQPQPSTSLALPSTSFITGTHSNMPNSTSSLPATSSHAPSTSLVPASTATPSSGARWITPSHTPSNTPTVNGGTIAALGSLSVSLVIASGVLVLIVGVYMIYRATACIYHKVKKTNHHDLSNVKVTSPSSSLRPPLPLPAPTSIYETVNTQYERTNRGLQRSTSRSSERHSAVSAVNLGLPDPPYINHSIYQVPRGKESEYIQMNSIPRATATHTDDGYNTADLQVPIYDETPNYDHVPTPTHVSDSWYVNHADITQNGRVKMLSECSAASIQEEQSNA